MIESLLEEISSLPNDETDDEHSNSAPQNCSEHGILATLPVVRAIVKRKTISSWHAEASDIIQSVALRLWKWREKYSEKSKRMSSDDWRSFAARTAYNEVNRYLSNQKADLSSPIENAVDVSPIRSAEGNTEAEFYSLAAEVWQNICTLSLRQKRALLLQSHELIVFLLKSGIDKEEILEVLEISPNDWSAIKRKLPLTDAQIAELIGCEEQNVELLARSIKKGRYEARKKLRRLMDK